MPNFAKQLLSIHGVPCEDQAFEEACAMAESRYAGKKSHRLVWDAAHQTGWQNLRNRNQFPKGQVEDLFKRKFSEVCKKFVDGEKPYAPLPESHRSTEVAESALEAIRNNLKNRGETNGS
ncbi:hypothetical protein ACIQVE_21330 [Pseudomonas sp. NPDC098747]|uniref:hypothetical protein n=1 Tax=Pseudomonas sp. NPDC098747 TaxID=3364487 RepID=UPI00383AB96A